MDAVNCCRFVGQLTSFSLSVVGEDKYTLGKGILFLPDKDYPSAGQSIKIIAWEETARRLKDLESGSWISILSSYSPSLYKGQVQDQFNVESFLQVK